MSARLSLDQAAAELGKTPRWLREWLRAHPADKFGEPYYMPAGRDKLFHPSDVDRIDSALREELKCRLVSGRRVRVKRRTTKSEDPTSASQWKRLAELTNEPSLLKNCEKSKSASSNTASTPPQPRLRLIQSNQPS